MNIAELKSRAREQLDNKIFSNYWLTAVLICAIFSAIIGFLTSTVFASILVYGPLNYGLCKIFVKQARDRQAMNIKDLFSGFTDDLSNNFLLGLMSTIFISLWSLLFVIPGIIKHYAYSLAYYIKADYPEYTWRECLSYSQQMMKGYKFKAFLLDLSFIGWYIVGSLCLGIGVLWVVPYHTATQTHFYATLLEISQQQQ